MMAAKGKAGAGSADLAAGVFLNAFTCFSREITRASRGFTRLKSCPQWRHNTASSLISSAQ